MEILLRDSTNSGKAGGGEEAVAIRQMEVDNIDILLLLLLLRRQMEVDTATVILFLSYSYLMEWLPSVKNNNLSLGGSGQKV